jgi:5-methylcytosine-specific restriction endonuclease McrA
MTCLECECAFDGRKRKFCTPACRNKANAKAKRARGTEKQCEHCGGAFIGGAGRRFCSNACANKNRASRPNRTCRHCGRTYQPKAANRVTFCSRDCAFAHKRATAKPPRQPEPRSCVICGGVFSTVYPKQLTCGAECQVMRRRRLETAGPRIIRCVSCGSEVQTDQQGPRRFCFSCSAHRRMQRRRSAKRRTRKDQNRRRRARLRGARVERFATISIFERDNYRCGICGAATNRAATVPHPDAPTLDHIVPLAKGGAHSRANVQCACFRCNTRKSDRIDYKPSNIKGLSQYLTQTERNRDSMTWHDILTGGNVKS